MAHNHLFWRMSTVLYLGLMTNLLLALSSLPLVILSVATDPRETWLLLAGAAVLAAPGLPAAFAVFANHADSGDSSVVGTFVRAWWRHAPRALLVGGVTVALAVILAVDIAWAYGRPVGAVAIPVLATLIVLVAAAGLGCLVAATERRDTGLPKLVGAATYLMTRRWYLTLVSLACAVVLATIVAQSPALGLGVTAAPLLYLVWTNTRFTLRPIL